MTNLSDLFGGSGKIIDTQTFASSGTWTKPAGILDTDLVIVDLWGGGGSGGVYGQTSDKLTGSPGGGGGHNQREFRAINLSSSEPVVVGSGGAPVTRTAVGSTDGNSGGYSEFKGHRAYGGGEGSGNSYNYGGTGGGVFEPGKRNAAAIVRGGAPFVTGVLPSFSTTALTAISDLQMHPGDWGGGFRNNTASNVITPIHGGAAGNGTQALRSSVWGGGAGGSSDGVTSDLLLGGLSQFGGKGGDATQPSTNTSNVNGQDGSAPGGGGSGAKWGSTGTVTSGAGGAGRVVITVIRGI